MILDALSCRRSCRSFKPDPVSHALIEEIIKAAQFAPTAHNRRAVEFVVVTDPKVRQAIQSALVAQDFVARAPVLIVPVSDTKIASKPTEDLALATENIWLQVTHLKLGCVWKHVHAEKELSAVRAILGIPEHCLIINVIPVGYPTEKPAPHTDAEFDPKRIHREKW
ncbi:MAG: nitroreductase family protein [Candidatus Peribacteraceae bacterium]|nr:nitroreductase family protein [Candidatus Peribacteraceae bacterium]MDD5742225.1 nitroreductase family protein [Candidatus Peribacteraceae bacterium]